MEWKFKHSNLEYIFDHHNLPYVWNSSVLIREWVGSFPKEDTWVQKNLGIPSLFIRLDCVVREDGNIGLYEIEERPSGLSTAKKINKRFSETLAEVRKQWPEFKVLISSKRTGDDDWGWDIEKVTYEEALSSDSLLLIRAEPEELEYHAFESRSISSLIQKGNKRYGLSMGLWKEVTLHDFDNFNWNKGFCLKPFVGSKCSDIEIWYPGLSAKDRKGSGASSQNKIRETLEKNKSMFFQEFINPMISSNEENMILRVFFLYNPKDKEYEYAGGFWNSRGTNFKIHGATDTTFGPVV